MKKREIIHGNNPILSINRIKRVGGEIKNEELLKEGIFYRYERCLVRLNQIDFMCIVRTRKADGYKYVCMVLKDKYTEENENVILKAYDDAINKLLYESGYDKKYIPPMIWVEILVYILRFITFLMLMYVAFSQASREIAIITTVAFLIVYILTIPALRMSQKVN